MLHFCMPYGSQKTDSKIRCKKQFSTSIFPSLIADNDLFACPKHPIFFNFFLSEKTSSFNLWLSFFLQRLFIDIFFGASPYQPVPAM